MGQELFRSVSLKRTPQKMKKIVIILISVTSKKSPNIYKKVAQKDFTRKMEIFDTFAKIALKCGQFGQNNCCHRLWNVAQSAINRPIWSHCNSFKFLAFWFSYAKRFKRVSRTGGHCPKRCDEPAPCWAPIANTTTGGSSQDHHYQLTCNAGVVQ